MDDKNQEDKIISDYEDTRRKVITEKSDYIIATIFEKIQTKGIILDPEYQRNFVWTEDKSSQLIESIFLGIPIPTIYLSEGSEYDEVIDGQQRLTAIYSFMRGVYPNNKVFKLKGLKELSFINGLTYEQLPRSLIKSFSDFNITVIKIKKVSHMDTKFDIFERLNKGSEKLTDQEIRNCIYRGPFNKELNRISNNEKVKRFFSEEEYNKLCNRMEIQSIICSFFASYKNKGVFIDSSSKKQALNKTMMRFNENYDDVSEIRIDLFKTLDIIYTILGKKAFHRKKVLKKRTTYKFNSSLFMTLTSFFSDFEKNQVIKNADNIREEFEKMKDSDMMQETLDRQTTNSKMITKRFAIVESFLGEYIETKENRYFTKDMREFLFYQDNTCRICQNKILSLDDAHVDHIIPFAQGGKTIYENAQIAHKYCNIKKG